MNNTEQIELILHWTRNVKRAQFAHYRMADRYKRKFTLIGIAITLITFIGGSAFVADLPKHVPQMANEINFALAFVLLVGAVLSALQTLLRLDEKGQIHRTSAVKYSAAKRHLGQLLSEAKVESISKQRLDELRKNLDGISNESPLIPDNVLRKIEKHMPPTPFESYYQNEDIE